MLYKAKQKANKVPDLTHVEVVAEYQRSRRRAYVSVIPVNVGIKKTQLIGYGLTKDLERMDRLNNKRLQELTKIAVDEIASKVGVAWDLMQKLVNDCGLEVDESPIDYVGT